MEDTTRTAELRRKLEKDPGSRLFAQFAEELRKEGRHDEAISVARKGLEKNPNYPSARLTLARSLLDSGRPAEARPELELVVKASPDNILAGRLLGEVLEDLGQFPEAVAQLEKTLRFAPGDKAIVEKIAAVKARMQLAAAAPAPAPVAAATLAFEAPSVFPSVPGVDAPSVLVPEVATPASLPSVSVPEPSLPSLSVPELPSVSVPDLPSVSIPELPAVSVPELPSVAVPEPPALAAPSVPAPPPANPIAPTPAPAPAVALDRDLASGTLSPGAFKVSDLNFEAPPAQSREAAAPPPAKPQAPPQVSASAPAEDSDIGGQTLPLTSVTLADLYLQQGLKAEASAVLSQVMREEPENVQAKSKFEAVSRDLEIPAEVDPTATEPAPPLPPVAAVPQTEAAPAPRAKLTKAEVRERTILSLKAFQSAIEREALEQRATEQRPL